MLQAGDLGLDPYGLSFHVGSQQTETASYEAAIGQVAMLFTDLQEAGVNLRMVNLGGGFPVRYRDEVPEIDRFGDAIMGAMTKHFGNALPEMLIEPGRFIVGDAGVVSSEVILVSRRDRNDPVRWVYLDIGRFGGLAETTLVCFIRARSRAECCDAQQWRSAIHESAVPGEKSACENHRDTARTRDQAAVWSRLLDQNNALRAATHARFITPITNSSAISAQQHPTHKTPCLRPILNAPPLPPRHSVMKKPNGDRQLLRQASFRGVSWKTPAITRIAAPISGGAVRSPRSRAARCNAHCAIVAATLQSVHTTR